MARSDLPALTVAGGDSCKAILGEFFSLFSVNSSLCVPRFNPDAVQLSSGLPAFAVYVDIMHLLFAFGGR